jgi:hypothetical protein
MPAEEDPRTADEKLEDRVALLLLSKMRPDVRDEVLDGLTIIERNDLAVAQYWERKRVRREEPSTTS